MYEKEKNGYGLTAWHFNTTLKQNFKEKIKTFFKENQYYFYLLAITFVLFSVILTNKTVVGADSLYHFSNIFSMTEKIMTGHFDISKLLPIIGNGLFYGNQFFYATLPHTITAFLGIILQLLGMAFPIVKAMKIMNFLIFFLSSVVMFKFIKDVSKDKLVAFVGSCFYLTFPFKLCNVFVRDGFTETFTFLFVPMVFYSLYLLLFNQDKKRFYFYFIIGSSGVLFSHILTTLFVAIAGAIFLLFHYKKLFQNKNWKAFLISLLWIIGITAVYLFPFLEQKTGGNYVIFSPDIEFNKSLIMNSILTLKNLFFWNPVAGANQVFIPITVLIGAVISIVSYKKIAKKGIPFLKTGIFIILLFLFLMTNKFIFEHAPSFVYIIQYVWRMLIIPFLFLAIISPLGLLLIKNKNIKRFVAIFLVITTTGIAYFTTDHFYVTTYNMYHSDLSANGMGWQQEYLPVNAKKHLEQLMSRDQLIHVNNENVSITITSKEYTNLDATIENPNHELVEVELPYIFYLGYKGTVNGKEIKLAENQYGMLSFTTKESGIIKISYPGTFIMQATRGLSFITCISYVVFLVVINKRKN